MKSTTSGAASIGSISKVFTGLQLAQAVEDQVAEGGNGQRNADHQQREQGVERRRQQAADSAAASGLMLG